MSNDGYVNYESGYHHHESATFNDILVEQLRNTPWLLISLAIHVVIALILLYISTDSIDRQKVNPFEVSAQDTLEDEMIEEEVEEETEEIKPEEEVTEEPVIKDTEISDHNETDNNEEWEESKGEEDQISDKPFDGTQTNDAIGLGGGAGGAFGGRRGGRRNLRALGGGGKTQRAVERGLEWLSNHQSQDGRWDCDNFMANGDSKKGPLCDGKGIAMYDVGVTGLALLAFLGAGNTHREGPYKATVRKSLKWLKGQQDAEGCFGPRGDPHFTYNHGIGALAMAEAYGMTRSGIWKATAQNGINFVMKCQNPYKAWRYGERPGGNDISVSGWMVMALKSAKMSGLDMNDTALQWAHDFCKEMTDEETGRTGYTKRGERPVRAEGRLEQFPAEESESLTGVGMLIRIFAGEDPKSSAMCKAGSELCAKRLPVWAPKQGKVDMYYWYYATLSMFQVGGSEWTAWNNKMKGAIIDHQREDGNYLGSWDNCGPWGEDGGRVYSTAVMTLCMEVYYRYGRVFGTK
ncbi:MAG: hypothetical protein CMJ83_06215 [Planctomycetes bacterium]|nr:hypothetical protein [Planctomycetota bacterium]